MPDPIILGCEYNWWVGDPLPALAPLDGFQAAQVDDVELLEGLQKVGADEIKKRLDEGNRCYVAFLDREPVGYGWAATRVGQIADLDLTWPLAPHDRHLWDFVTLPAYRGRGVYPHLLQYTLRAESQEAEHFWIGHRGDNLASQRGIVKAGFNLHWLFVLTSEGELEHQPQRDMARVKADPRWAIIQRLFENPPSEMVEQLRSQIEF